MKRNAGKFPEDFMFKLTVNEWQFIRSQFVTGSEKKNRSQTVTSSQKHRSTPPYAFTEHGVTMLASVLKSKRAIDKNIAIVRAFIAMRHFANSHKDLFEQINDLRKEMQIRLGEHDTQLAAIYDVPIAIGKNLLDKKEEDAATKQQWKERERIGLKK